MAVRLCTADPDFDVRLREMRARQAGAAGEAEAVAAEVFAAVRRGGDAAVADLSERFDGCDPRRVGGIVLGPAEMRDGALKADKVESAALAEAAARIWRFHLRQMPADDPGQDDQGIVAGWRWRPVESVGVYAPGGRAAYPSSVLMSAIPARVAGVSQVTLATPPAVDGTVHPLVLAAAAEAGCDRVCRVGGAQAIAALAIGTASVPRADVIVGPGSRWVTAAKRLAFGTVGIEALAGPSELVVIADGDADPEWVAWDLLAQAEHDPEAQAILITADAELADAVEVHVEQVLDALAGDVARRSWTDRGAVVIVESTEAAVVLADRLAPEHLHIATRAPDAIADRVRNAGAVFVGACAPEVLGDYLAGPSHVLPTGGTARWASGLSVLSFLKRTSVIRASAAASARWAPTVERLARAEGLEAHARSARLRGAPG